MMKCFSLFLLLAIYCVGNATAKAIINLPTTLLSEQPTSGNCVAIGKTYSHVPRCYIRVKVDKERCTVKLIGRFQKLKEAHYQQSFNITCNNSNYSVEIKCFTCINEIAQTDVQVIKPKITSKSSNITTEIGLPVTLKCYVEGDPNHYYVGWLNRQTIIQPGDEHSISTFPNFRSDNGTAHYLTIHRIEVSGKYECILYTITGEVQDQVTHEIFITKESHKTSESLPSSSSFFSILSSFFF